MDRSGATLMEWKLFDGRVPHVSTAEYHQGRDRAAHLEQPFHSGRLHLAARLVSAAVADLGGRAGVSDLGCGDGGLLSLVQTAPGVTAWGYDFTPSMREGWKERGVTAYSRNAFGTHRKSIQLGDVVVITEVLEHLADPHGVLRWLRTGAQRLVCSSPFNENDRIYDECHAWAWDTEGYAAMIEAAGWTIDHHEQVDLFQVVRAR